MTTAPGLAVTPDEVAELYRQHHCDLERAVAGAVNAPREVVEDACQSAWTIVLRSQPRRPTWFAWLRVVAIHEAYALCRSGQRDAHLEELANGDAWEELFAGRSTLDDAIEARRALRLLAELPARQREDLSLLVAGFTYREIGEKTGGRTYTNVNKHLAKARARIRRAESRTANGANSVDSRSS